MDATKRRTPICQTLAALARMSPLLLLAAAPSAIAQERTHLRVQFESQAAWNDLGARDAGHAPLPAGPAPANYSGPQHVGAYAPEQRLRIRPEAFGRAQ
jgi:hypothetical protein